MQNPLIALTLVAAIALPAIGIAGNDVAATGPVADQIRAMLTEQGYEIRKIEAEANGLYEAYAVKDGVREEIYVTADLQIVSEQTDDAEDGDDD